jgi:hypothetical protein
MKELAILVLTVHLAWIVLVIIGALWTRDRPVWSAAHILSLVWGIAVELGPWPCPLTLAEEHFESAAGMAAYQGGFVLHYLDAIVYPNLPGWLVGGLGAAVCAINLGIYGWRWRSAQLARRH